MENSTTNVIIMPTVPTRGIVVFPGIKTSIDIGRVFAVNAVKEAVDKDKKIFLVMQRDESVSDPSINDCLSVGVVATITNVIRVSADIIRITVEGEYRARLEELYSHDEVFRAGVGEVIRGDEPQKVECESYKRLIMATGKTVAAAKKINIDFAAIFKNNTTDMAINVLSDVFLERIEDIKAIMECTDTLKRLRYFCEYIIKENEIINIEKDIALQVKQQMD